MEKVMYCLWRPEPSDPDAWSGELRAAMAALRVAGASVSQVNVDDTDVRDASIRMSTFDTPMAAVVSVWFDTAADPDTRGAVEAALGALTGRVAGYLVTESIPLAAPADEPGTRTDGLANLAFLRRPADLDSATWLQRWQGNHTTIAIGTQSTFGYVQNVVVRSLTDDAPVIDGIVEELFPMAALTDFHVFFDTGGDDALLGQRMEQMNTSVAAFCGPEPVMDVVPTSRYCLVPPLRP